MTLCTWTLYTYVNSLCLSYKHMAIIYVEVRPQVLLKDNLINCLIQFSIAMAVLVPNI